MGLGPGLGPACPVALWTACLRPQWVLQSRTTLWCRWHRRRVRELGSRLTVLAARQDGVLTWAQLRAGGVGEGQARGHLRSGRWVRLRRGAYLVDRSRGVDGDFWPELRAVALTVPGAVLCGSTAARLWGVDVPTVGALEVAVRPDRPLHSRSDLRVRTFELRPDEVVRVRGMAVTTPDRTVVDVVLASERPDALAVLDNALRRKLVAAADLPVLSRSATGRPGAAHVADLWAWADGRAESSLESRVRFRCIEGGVPPDDLQVEVRDARGSVLARADMAYRRRSRTNRGLLLVEADGAAVHAAPAAIFRDREKQNALTGEGADVLRFTWRDTLDRLSIPRTIRSAL